ncbi:MAG: hypothetical protein WA126_14115 [Thermodesulfovibrionales bacterium]
MKKKLSKEYTINDLPRFSSWPARLLGIDLWEQKYKTKEEIIREYEHEKWGPLLSRVQKEINDITLEKVEKWMIYDTPDVLCSIGEKLKLLTAYKAHQRYMNLLEKTLKQYLPASSIVELGCGYGSIILKLAKNMNNSSMSFLAAEYTESGKELTNILARAENISIDLGYCDFTSPEITTLAMPEDAIIFTSYATPYVPRLQDSFIEGICKFNPKIVIHFEPCYEHCEITTLLGLMRKRYIEVNDYNNNLVTLLYRYQKKGIIKIIDEKPTIFGKNPILTASILIWKPVVKNSSNIKNKVKKHDT